MSLEMSCLCLDATLGSASLKAVALALADGADCYHSCDMANVGRIARRTELSEDEVRDVISELEAMGVLIGLAEAKYPRKDPDLAGRLCFDPARLRALESMGASS